MENKVTIYNENDKIEFTAATFDFKNVNAPTVSLDNDIRKHKYNLTVTGHCDYEHIVALSNMRNAKKNIYDAYIQVKYYDTEYSTFNYENLEFTEFEYSFSKLNCNQFAFKIVLEGQQFIR